MDLQLNYSRYAHLGDITPIVEHDLCTRCGACALCPFDAIEWGEDYYPRVISDKCTDCGVCMAVCPGGDMDIKRMARQVFKDDGNVDHPLGTILEPFIAYSIDEDMRNAGAGGGVVTRFLTALMESDEIDGAILVAEDPDQPWRSKPVVALTLEEIRASAGSRYTIVPTLQAIPDLRHHEDKRFALVCLPCQVHGLRMLERVVPRLTSRIKLVIGLYCGSNWELDATTSLIQRMGVDFSNVAHVEYRAGAWPGEFRVTTKQGEVKAIPKRIFNYLRFMHTPERCTTCVDMASEFADIAIGDAWFRTEDGSYPFANCSTVLTRTPRGLAAFQKATHSGALGVMETHTNVFVKQHMPGINTKKLIAFQRTRRQDDVLSPDYHMPIERLGRSEQLGVVVYDLALRIARWPVVQQVATAILPSPPGLWLIETVSRLRKKLDLDLV